MRSTVLSRRANAHLQRAMLEALEPRTLMSVAADPINALYTSSGGSISVPAGKSIILPLTSSADSAVTYQIGTPAGWTATVRNGSSYPFVKLHVKYGAAHTEGDIVIQLFPDIAPNTVSIVEGFINSGFYNNIPWHRIVGNFGAANTYIVQGGDFGNGTDPTTIGNGQDDTGLNFNDEFNPNAIFDGNGQLAMANSGKDTNGSQYFITYQDAGLYGPRFLDFNHTIFGQVVRGWDVLAALAKVPADSNGKPTDPATVVSATLGTDTSDATITLTAPATVGSGTLTITATDAGGNVSVQHASVAAVTDATDDPPILGPVGDYAAHVNTPIVINLSATDIDAGSISFAFSDPAPNATASVSSNVITVTPTTGFSGTITMLVGATATGATTRGSSTNPYDIQTLHLTWTNAGTAPTAVAKAADLYEDAGASTRFDVTFSSNNVLDASTLLGNQTVIVTGPNGYSAWATPVGITETLAGTGRVGNVAVGDALNGATRTVTYSFAAPGGNWTAADAGFYYIRVMPGIVKDMLGDTAGASIAGRFFYSPTALYSEAFYVGTYPDVAAAINSGALTSGYEHFINTGQYEGRQPSLYYSDPFYLNLYADLRTALANHQIASGFTHFLYHGQIEGRLASPYFDEFQYRKLNPDVDAAVKAGQYVSGLDHFIRFGEVEGRSPSYWFTPSVYAANNSDVVAAVAAGSYTSLFEHFMLTGANEGRIASTWYQEAYYLAHNADVAAAVSSHSYVNGYIHFIMTGLREERKASPNFDPQFYLSTYPDVAAAVAAGSFHSALEHYLMFGQAEGRLAHA